MSRGPRVRGSFASDAITLAVVSVVAGLLVAWRVTVAVNVGPGWDTFAFLSNAAEFAGRGYGYAELHRPPLLSLITALAFRLGAPMHESVIQWADGVLSFSAIIAFYLVARRRFAAPLAGAAALGLLVVQPLWTYLGVGYTDLPSIALSLWFLLAIIAATEKSPHYYGLAALLFVAAVLTRYTALLVIFPGLLWFALRASLFRHARAVAVAAVLGIVAYLPMGRFYARRFGDGLFPFVLAFSVSEAVTAPDGEGAVSAAGPYYLANLPAFLAGKGFSVLGWLLLVGAAVGLLLGLTAFLLRARPSLRRVGFALLGVGLAVGGQLAGGMFLRQFSLPVAVFLVWRALAPNDENGRVDAAASLDAVMLLWFLTYFDFHGHQAIQVPRYVVTMAPALMYFMALGWWQAVADIGRTLSPQGAESTPRPAWPSQTGAAMGLGLVLSLAIATTVTATPTTPDPLVTAARDTAHWLKRHAPDLEERPVYSDLWPLTAWYARSAARPMPFFKDDRAFHHELTKSQAEYFVTIRSRRFDDFEETATAGAVKVLQRQRPALTVLPRVAYLGKAWDNYLETVTDFSLFLDGDAGRYGWEGTAFLDELSPSELEHYEAVAVFGVRWRDRARGEAALGEYLRDGGSVIVDASGNIGELPYELGDTVMFDTVIKRGLVPENATIEVDPAFADAHRDIGEMDHTPYRNETGGGWYGAEYSPLPGTEPLRVLASVNGKPVVAVRDVGRGRVYWIGYNLVWHAFLSENDSESRLVRAVFDDAIAHARGTGGPSAKR